MPDYDSYRPVPRRPFINREEAFYASQTWNLTDIELALAYEEAVLKNLDMHYIQNEVESRDLTLDDLEEILSDIQQ